MHLPDLSACMKEELRPHVEKGVAWLDEKHSDWVAKVCPTDLDLSSSHSCICGQVLGGYYSRPAELSEAWRYGFDIEGLTDVWLEKCQCGCGSTIPASWATGLAWRTLQGLWEDEVYWRTEEEI